MGMTAIVRWYVFFYFPVIAIVHGRKLACLFPVVDAMGNVVQHFPRFTQVGRKTVGSRSHGGVLAECEDY